MEKREGNHCHTLSCSLGGRMKGKGNREEKSLRDAAEGLGAAIGGP